MSRSMCLLLLTGFVAFATMTGSAVAARNCPKGATCKCVPTTFTNCDIVNGKQVCTRSKGKECTVISGPGSGKRTQ